MIDENLIPIMGMLTFFGFLGTVIVVLSRYRSLEKQKLIETARLSVEKGQVLSPDVVRAMAEAHSGRRTAFQDLRLGVVLTALGLGIAFFGLGIGLIQGAFNAAKVFAGIGAIPATVGVALIILSRFNPYKDRPE